MKSPSNDSPDRVLELAGPSVIIGRGRGAQLRLPGEDVSAAHARLQWTDGGLRVEDLGSVNGTRAASQSLEPGRTYSLDWGAPVHIADYQLTVLDPATPGTAIPASPLLTDEAGTATLAAHLVRDMAGDRDSARLRVQDPTGAEQVVPMAPGDRLRLGRDPGCQVRLADPDLSREHVEIRMSAAGATLRDLASKNGVTVNGAERLSLADLHHGDVIRLGGSTAWYEDPAEALLAELNQLPDGDPPADPSTGEPPPEPDPHAESESGADPPTPTPTTRPQKNHSRPEASPGRLGRALLIGLGLTLMGAAIYLLLWLFI